MSSPGLAQACLATSAAQSITVSTGPPPIHPSFQQKSVHMEDAFTANPSNTATASATVGPAANSELSEVLSNDPQREFVTR